LVSAVMEEVLPAGAVVEKRGSPLLAKSIFGEGGAGGDTGGESGLLMQMARSQEAHTKALEVILSEREKPRKAKTKKKRSIFDPPSREKEMGEDGSSSDEDVPKGHAGLRGMDWWRTEKNKDADWFLALLLERAASAASKTPQTLNFRNCTETRLACSGHQFIGRIEWYAASPLDHFMTAERIWETVPGESNPEAREEKIQSARRAQKHGLLELLLLYVSLAQCMVDEGSWKNSHPMTLSEDMPWGSMNKPRTSVAGGPESQSWHPLVPQELITSVRTFRKAFKDLDEKPKATPAKATDGSADKEKIEKGKKKGR